MKILVDTSVWSLSLRRKKSGRHEEADRLKQLIENGEQIYLIGVILQEILSGISDLKLFNRLKDYLGAFPIINLDRDDYINAARIRNECGKKGVNAGTIDFLIASVCSKYNLYLFSADKDFREISKFLNLKLIS